MQFALVRGFKCQSVRWAGLQVDWSKWNLMHSIDNESVDRLAEALAGNTVCHTVDIRSDRTTGYSVSLPPSLRYFVSVSARAVEQPLQTDPTNN